MKIGPYQLKNNLILAPMAGVTDRPFRELCIQFGAAVAVGEMVSSNPLLRKTRKSMLRLDHRDEAGLRWVQIAGSEPEVMAEAAQYNVEQGAEVIDINMGCPAKKVCRKAAGSALLADEGLVEAICQAVYDAVEVPVTLKIRTGVDTEHRNAVRIAKIAERSGFSALTIHGRTKADKFNGFAEYKTIRDVREKTSMTLIANGDIDSATKAKEVLDITEADGLMIGRSAQGRPWIFREINQYISQGEIADVFADEEVEKIMLHHIHELHQFYGDDQGVKFARKHVAWYLKGSLDAKTFRALFNVLKKPEEQLLAIKNRFEQNRLSMVS